MELRQLKYFVKAAETLNFTDASKHLYITQSTLSQQIKQLEVELGVLLFDRIGKKVFLTEAGNEFLPFARQTLRDAEIGKQRILDLQGIRTGVLRIGITYSLSIGLAPTILRFVKEYPNIKLDIVYNTITELQLMLKNHELDLILSFNSAVDTDIVDVTNLFEVPLCVVAHLRHPLAFHKRVSLVELNNYLLALPSKGLNARRLLDRLASEYNIALAPKIEMNDVNIILQLVESSLYISVLSATTVIGHPDLRSIPITEQKDLMMASLLTLKGAYEKASAKAFIEYFMSAQGKKKV